MSQVAATFSTEASLLEGTRRARAVGFSIVDAFTPYAVPGLDEGFAGVLTRVKSDLRAVVGHELRAVLPDRGVLDWTFNVSPLKDGTEAPQGLAIVLDDQTEKKRLLSKYEVHTNIRIAPFGRASNNIGGIPQMAIEINGNNSW